MALEFNADKQIIQSEQLKIKNSTSVRIDLGGGADEKAAIFGNLTADADKLVRIGINTLNPQYELDVEGQIRTTTSIISDTARIANLDIDTIVNPSLALRAPVLNTFTDPNTNELLFPRSTTPAYSDDSNKIATTNFVYNIATNDVGGRIYVSAQIGSDTFDGRSATKPVRTIKRATQLAAESTDEKETIIVAGGDYLEDNPISLPNLCSVVGDNIRLCIIRPANPGKHMFKASNENYVTGITFRDQVDSNNVPLKTWSYAYVFDDKQRFYYPKTLGGQFGRTFNLGHKIAAAQEWKLNFISNGGGTLLVPGIVLTSVAGGTGTISEVVFNTGTDQAGYVVIQNITGLIESTGSVYTYDANDPVVNYNLSVSSGEQLTPDGQVVKHVTTHTSYSVSKVKYDPLLYPSGLIVTVTGTNVFHDFEVGQYVRFVNFPDTSVNATYGDLDRFNGRQYVSHRIETADGFSTQFVVYKDTPTDLIALGAAGGEYSVTNFAVTVESDDHYATFSLDNSPRKFATSTKSPNRYLDAVDLIGRNKLGIADQALKRAKKEYPALMCSDEQKCLNDMGYIIDAITYDLTWGGNAATKEAAEYYYTGGVLDHLVGSLKESTYTFSQARDLTIQAMRNQLEYVDSSTEAAITRVASHTETYEQVIWDNERFIAVGSGGIIHTSADGATWTAQTSGITTTLYDVLFNKWAVGERGVPEYIAVGQGGKVLITNNPTGTWYEKTTPISDNLRAVAYDGTTYVAVGAAGKIITSQNGNTWVSQTSGVTNVLRDIIYNDDYDAFIAVGTGGKILKSTDSGVTWTELEGGTSKTLASITWSEGRTIINAADGYVLLSDDGGTTWETNTLTNEVTTDRNQDAADLLLANKKLLAAQGLFNYLNNGGSGHTVPTGNMACVDDIVDVVEAIAFNLRHGGNDRVWEAANYYVGTTHVDGEEAEAVGALDAAIVLAKSVIRNVSITVNYVNDATYVASLETPFKSLTQYTKPDITLDYSEGTRHSATNATYDPDTGVVELTITGHGFENGEYIKIDTDSLKFTCSMDGNYSTHSYPREEDPANNAWLQIFGKTDNTISVFVGRAFNTSFSPTGGTYDPETGLMTLTVGENRFKAPSSHTVTDAAYDPNSGIMTVTVPYHGFYENDHILFEDNSVSFTCTLDGNVSTKSYPRSTDAVSGRWLNIWNVTRDTFDVQVLDTVPSTDTSPHTFVSAVADGLKHSSENVKLNTGSVSFSCNPGTGVQTVAYPRNTVDSLNTPTGATYDPATGVFQTTINGHGLKNGDWIKFATGTFRFQCTMDPASPKDYPRASDPANDAWLKVTNVTTNTFEVNVGKSPIVGHEASAGSYDAATGDLVLNLGPHSLTPGTAIKIAKESLAWKCGMDNNTATKVYPRTTDPAYDTALDITAADANTITVNVGQSPLVNHDINNATYNPVTGDVVMTLVGAHSLTQGESIRIGDDKLTFTCTMDGNATNHTYPREGDPAYQTAVPITNVSGQDITVNVGTSPIVNFTVTAAIYNPNSGDLVLTIGNHSLRQGTNIKLADNSLVFTCTLDGNVLQKSYPRASGEGANAGVADYAYDRPLPITAITSDTITINVNQGGNPISDLSTHTFVSGTNAVVTGGNYTHTWSGGTSTAAVISGGNYPHTFQAATGLTPSDAAYNPTTGKLTLTFASAHQLSTDDYVKLDENALSFTCTMDNNTATKQYPRSSDPIAGKYVQLENVTTFTFDLDVGTSPLVTFTPTDGEYTPSTGVMTLEIGKHDLKVGTNIKLAANSISFKCGLDNFTAAKSYPRSSGTGANAGTPDAAYDVPVTITDTTKTSITINVGTSSDTSEHRFDSATSGAVISGGGYTHTFTGATNNSVNRAQVLSGGNYIHTFVSSPGGGVSKKRDRAFDTSIPVVAKTTDSVTLFVGISTSVYAHTFVSAQADSLIAGGNYVHTFLSGDVNGIIKNGPESPTTACTDVINSIVTLNSIVTSAITNDNMNHASKTYSVGSNQFLTLDAKNSFHDGHRFWLVGHDNSQSMVISSEDRGRTWQVQSLSANASSEYKTVGFSDTVGLVLGAANDIRYTATGSEFTDPNGLSQFSTTIDVFSDNTISNTYDANRHRACDNVSNSIFTLWNIVIDRINGRTIPATSYATSYFLDSNNKFFTVGHAFDDLPVIEVSPYIFNSSVISFLGGNGCEIDGAKCATPNVKRPNLPPQGKSMVAAAFTIISFGGTGYRVINDGYTQLVSVFCIFTQDGAIVESGGYASLTNSASNFGTFSLRSTGVREEAYSFDKGVIDNVTFTDVGTPKFTVTGLGAAPLEHYIISPGGFDLQLQSGQNPRYFIENTISATPTKPITAEIQADLPMNVRGNFNRFTDSFDLITNNARYIAEEAYFKTLQTTSNSLDQDRNKCIRDTEEIVKAWAKDLKFDANDATWDAAKLYINGTSIQHIVGYVAATKEVLDEALVICKKAINNQLKLKGTTLTTAESNANYYVAQWTDEVPYVDYTITHDVSTGTEYTNGDCTNVQSALTTLNTLFDEIIDNPSVTTPMPSTAVRNDGFFQINAANKNKLIDHRIDIIRPSICNSSSHTWEFSGSGNDYNALPQNGGTRGSDNTGDFEQVSQSNGRVYASGTDELGDFKIGYFANVENRTGNITFGGTVTISEVEFLKIKGNNVVITGFSPDNTLGALELGGSGANDSLLPTQKAVKDYISNQLGQYLGRTYSTVPTPNALVQLDASGRINIDQLPALRPFNIFTVADAAARYALEGPLAGDIVIQNDNTISYIMNNDLESQILEFVPASNHVFSTSDIILSTGTGSQGQVTSWTPGRIKQIVVANGGSGYLTGDTITISSPGGGGTQATGTLTINGGQITGVTLNNNGQGYYTPPSTAGSTITINTSTGSNAVLTSIIRSRLEVDILNSIKALATDTIDDKTTPTAITIQLTDVINTSASNANNWVQLTSSTIDASFITTGVINVARLGNITSAYPANSLTYLRGDSLFAPAMASQRIADDSPIVLGSNNTASDYIKQIQIVDGGEGYNTGVYTDTLMLGGGGTSTGLKGTFNVANGVVSKVNVTAGGTGYTTAPTVTFKDNWTDPANPAFLNNIKAVAIVSGGAVTAVHMIDGGTGLGSNTPLVEFVGGGGVDAVANSVTKDGAIRFVTITDGGNNYTADFTVTPNPTAIGTSPTISANLKGIIASVPKIFGDSVIDINRVDDLTVAANDFGNLGVIRLRKDQFTFGVDGSATLRTGQGSGLDADTLDTRDSSFFTNADNIQAGLLSSDRLSGDYGINITGNAATATLLNASDTRTSIFNPENFASGMILSWKSNSQGYNTNQFLDDGGLYHSVLTTRRAGSSTDFSAGALGQIAQTDNNNIYIRNSGPNFVGSLTITNAGAGYKNGTYNNVLLGGGEGYGLKANIVVSGGSISSITLIDGGYGYNEDGTASGTFIADLPYAHFGTQNTRQITTPAVITATLAVLGSGQSTGNIWSTWRKVWHDGNHGKGSGLNADLLCNYGSRWWGDALNINQGRLSDRRIPDQLGEKAFNESISITVPDPNFQANNGGHYDLYLEGYNLTQEVIDQIDTQPGVGGRQYNLYTANNVNEGTIRIISRKINLDPANYLTGVQYVESNTEWVANATANKNERIVYGHNIYNVTNSITGSYSLGTTPPTHNSGTVTAPGGNAQLTFERKVENPWTILTVELISGNLSDSIKKIGTASAPAEYYTLTDWSVAKDKTYSRTKAILGSDASANPYLQLGDTDVSATAYIDANTSGNNVDYDSRIEFTGGSSSVGTGTINFRSNSAQVNGNNIWHAGNITFDSANTASTGVIRDASGNFSAGTITAALNGTANGNLPITGGTLTGTLTIDTTSDDQITFVKPNKYITYPTMRFRASSTGTQFSVQHNSVAEIFGVYTQNFGTSILTVTGGSGGNFKSVFIRLQGNSSSGLVLQGDTGGYSAVQHKHGTLTIGYRFAYANAANHYGNGTAAGDVIDRVETGRKWHFKNGSNVSTMVLDDSRRVAIAQSSTNSSYQFYVNGSLGATSKSFVIDHPTKENHELRHGSLEGPEHAVYVRGRVRNGVIHLPEYWTELVDISTITVQLTAIGNMSRTVWVKDLKDNKVITGGGDAFYFIQAERKDIDKLEVEFEKGGE